MRYNRFTAVFLAAPFYLTGCAVLRCLLWLRFGEAHPGLGVLACAALVGLRMDLAAAAWMFLPPVLWLALLPERIFSSKPHRMLLTGALTLYFPVQLFLFKTNYEFFAEFNSRFNTVAVDYLIYPHEVFINIWDSYPIVKVTLACLLAGALAAVGVRRLRLDLWSPTPFRRRLAFLAAYVLCGAVLTQTVAIKDIRLSPQRVLNEIASNDDYSFVYAALTRDLDYSAFYRTLPNDEAFRRARGLLAQPGAVFEARADSIERSIRAAPPPRPRNVVILLVESFGSEFWGSLGRRGASLTPEMDALSREGLLFTNCYATGNRTVRGMEGVLSSFPPLPSDAIVKRHLSDDVATVARTLVEKGYSTLFLYGGRGLFDGMRSFAMRNGYERFIEEKDFPRPTFATIWGVCDEDIYHWAIDEFGRLYAEDRPFFATVLSVSNHKPYTYPTGRIPEDPAAHSRENAVKYTDWALGDFFRLAKKQPFYKDTIFAVVADHGARVYGSQSIPIGSYRIPLLIVNAPRQSPRRIGVLAGQLDIGPTLLGLSGLPYQSVFFGRDLLKTTRAAPWAVMNHNRDVGFYRNNRLVVLGLNKSAEHYKINPATGELDRGEASTKEAREAERDAIAIFQVADQLYTSQSFRVGARAKRP